MRWSSLLLLVGLVAGGIWLYCAISYVPAFYSAALAVAQPDLELSNRDMLRRTAALTNDMKRVGEWRAIFTQQQINGWLAVDLPKNHPDLLPAELQNPRIHITPDRVLAAARYESNVSAVVSLEFAATLQAPNQVALRIHTLRIGDVPWRMDQIVEQATAAARHWGLQVEQTQTDGDPVLLLTLPPERNKAAKSCLSGWNCATAKCIYRDGPSRRKSASRCPLAGARVLTCRRRRIERHGGPNDLRFAAPSYPRRFSDGLLTIVPATNTGRLASDVNAAGETTVMVAGLPRVSTVDSTSLPCSLESPYHARQDNSVALWVSEPVTR